jgi:predicted GNAT superfamily acetyltransferase
MSTDQVQIHPLMTMDALQTCEQLQLAVWGYADREVVPAAQMRAALHAGALVAGAFVGREQVGFVYGFPALPHEDGLVGVGMHSHMMAVVPEARGLGIGRRLKWFQRRWCAERGMAWVAWTFDPLQAGNARLNLAHLGAVVHEYQVDFYGVLGGELSGTLPTDRVVALWHLDHPHVGVRAAHDGAARFGDGRDEDPAAFAPPRSEAPSPDAPFALDEREDGGPGEPRLDLDDPVVRVVAPGDVSRTRREAPQLALDWREAFKVVLPAYFARGYEVQGFDGGAYRLVAGRLGGSARSGAS